MDRNAVSEMVCMECGTRQPVGSHCTHCATQMARYYCNICHLFDDEEGRDIYHCPFCNVCRCAHGWMRTCIRTSHEQHKFTDINTPAHSPLPCPAFTFATLQPAMSHPRFVFAMSTTGSNALLSPSVLCTQRHLSLAPLITIG